MNDEELLRAIEAELTESICRLIRVKGHATSIQDFNLFADVDDLIQEIKVVRSTHWNLMREKGIRL